MGKRQKIGSKNYREIMRLKEEGRTPIQISQAVHLPIRTVKASLKRWGRNRWHKIGGLELLQRTERLNVLKALEENQDAQIQSWKTN